MTYGEKLVSALRLLNDALRVAQKPILWCSFGQKSLVLLHIIRQLGRAPLIWMRPIDPVGDRRSRIRKLIREYDLEVFDYRPTGAFLCDPTGEPVYLYDLGGATIPVLFQNDEVGFDEPVRPDYPYGWDISFFGATEDYLAPLGALSLPADGTRIGNTHLCYPLRSWTKEEIARYAEEHGLVNA